MFELHPQLKNDLIFIEKLESSYLFLLPDSDNPWVVLVPEVPNITEFHELPKDNQLLLIADINKISKILEKEFQPDKINIGALGNMVPQLHIHIICRYKSDKAWPGAIWGKKWGEDKKVIEERVSQLKSLLSTRSESNV